MLSRHQYQLVDDTNLEFRIEDVAQYKYDMQVTFNAGRVNNLSEQLYKRELEQATPDKRLKKIDKGDEDYTAETKQVD